MKPAKRISVILKDQAKEEYEALCKIVDEQHSKGKSNSEEMQLLKSIKKKSDLLKQNPIYGQNIPKALIPKELNVDNLFRLELTNYWRMLYTLKTNEVEIIGFILYIIDHETYNKLLGYRNR